MFPFNLSRAAPGSTQIVLRNLAICFLLLAQNIGTRNYPHQHSAWVAALCTSTPQSWPGFSGLSVKQMDDSGTEGPSCSAGSLASRRRARDQERAALLWVAHAGRAHALLECYEASGPKLNRKTAAICLHCYLCFKRVTGCQCK